MELVLMNTQAASRSLSADAISNIRPHSWVIDSISLLQRDPPQNPFERRAEELLVRLTTIHTTLEAFPEEQSSLNFPVSFSDGPQPDDLTMFTQSSSIANHRRWVSRSSPVSRLASFLG